MLIYLQAKRKLLTNPATIDFNGLPQVASEVMALFFITGQDRLPNEEIAKQLGKEEGNVNKVVRRLLAAGLVKAEHRGIYTYFFIPEHVKKSKFVEKVVDSYLYEEWPNTTKLAPAFLKRLMAKAVESALDGAGVKVIANAEIDGKILRHNVDLVIELGTTDKRNIIPIFVLLPDKTLVDRLYQLGGEYEDIELKNIRAVIIISAGSLQDEYRKYLESKGHPGKLPSLDIIELSKGSFADIVSQLRDKLDVKLAH